MKTKEEVIKEAYGVKYNLVQEYLDENGKINFGFCVNGSDDVELGVSELGLNFEDGIYTNSDQYGEGIGYWQPKSLLGIENNNGWTTIESEDDLPEYGYYEVVVRETGEITRASLENEFRRKSLTKYYSHYQPIINKKPPIHK